MKDARVLELEFLAELDRQKPGEKPKRIGGTTDGVEADMWLHLVRRRAVEATDTFIRDSSLDAGTRFDLNHRQAFTELVKGGHIAVKITHRGRLRMQRLRDELRLNRGRDAFGILFDKQAFDRELAVELPFVDEG